MRGARLGAAVLSLAVGACGSGGAADAASLASVASVPAGHGAIALHAGILVHPSNATSGLEIVDVSDPTTPSSLAVLDGSELSSIRQVFFEGDVLWVVSGVSIHRWDLAEPATPVDLGRVGSLSAYRVAREGNRAYLSRDNELVVLDVSEPSAPTELGRTTPWDATGLLVRGGLVYASSTGEAAVSARGFHIYDYSDVSHPVALGEVPDILCDPAAWHDGVVFCGWAEGYHAFDVSDPAAPRLLVTFDDVGRPSYGMLLALYGDSLVLSTDAGLRYLPLDEARGATPMASDILGTPLGAHSESIAVDGDILAVLHGAPIGELVTLAVPR